jgi:RNA polymerase sigma-70 factor (ECF subfamily)
LIPPDLDSLILRSRSGDVTAFDRLVIYYDHMIFSICFRFLQDREGAEDATQEVFLKAWRSLSRVSGPGHFVPWLRRIAINHCLGVLRQRKREACHLRTRREPAPLGPEAVADGDSEAPFTPFPDRDLYLDLQQAIRALPEKLQAVVVLRYVQEASVAEIARALDVPERTARWRLKAALKRLHHAFRDVEVP